MSQSLSSEPKTASKNAMGASVGTGRLASVDVLRGLVMVVMVLDHTRDWFSSASALYDPTDLAHTTPWLFFTRWITHFCAPVFVFLAGSGAFLSLGRGRGRAELAKFLFTRGLWLIFLEVFIISPLGWSFSFSFAFTRLQVIWVIGASMVLMSGMVLLLSSRVIGCAGVVMIFAHDLLDGAHASWLGPFWFLHEMAFFPILPHKIIGSLYPIIPWVGVMMAGYGAGEILMFSAARRRQTLLILGTAATVLFIALRASNVYGDPSPWSVQSGPVFTVLSFLKCSKYPPSLLYLLMTLGPALILLGLLDNAHNWLAARLEVFGRVPLFYYLLHLPLLHVTAIVFSMVRYGSAAWLHQDFLTLRNSANPLPAGYGYGLPVVYAVWLGSVIVLYPACRWFADIKKTRRSTLLSYL